MLYPKIFQSIASIVDSFEHKIESSDNISNWITQIYSNEEFEHVVSIKGLINGYDVDVDTPEKFLPTTLKGNANTYQEMLRQGKFFNTVKDKKTGKLETVDFTDDDNMDTIITLLSYLIGWLFIGKPLASVNMGRGRLILDLIKNMEVKNMDIIIHNVSMGGSKPKQNINLNQDEIIAYCSFQNTRAINRLDKLDNKGNGKNNLHVNPVTKTQFIKRTLKKV